MSVFIPGKAETIIDYDCVPSFSQVLAAQIVNMNDNIIIPETSLKTGTIDFCLIQNMLMICPRFSFVRCHQFFKGYHYFLNKHDNGYFILTNGYYIHRNQTITKTRTDELNKDKQEIQRLKRALKGRSQRYSYGMNRTTFSFFSCEV